MTYPTQSRDLCSCRRPLILRPGMPAPACGECGSDPADCACPPLLPAAVPPRRIVLTPASAIEPEPVVWAWEDDGGGRIPAGSFGLAAGREAPGKSSWAIWLTAQVTTGKLPGQLTRRGVIYVATEDSWKFTIVPRLIAVGADLDHVFRAEVLTTGDDTVSLSLPAEPCGQCPQEVFAAADEHTVIMGGAAAGRKTLSVLMYAIRACVQHPRLRVGAFRRSYPELRDSLLAELAKYGYCADLGATFNQSEHELRFPNQSVITFRYAETLKDATRRQGSQFQLLVIDELSLFDWEVVSFLQSRIRSGRADIPVLGVRATCNPGGPSHHQVKKILERTGFGERTYTDERDREVRFVRAGLKHNPYINAEYAADLRALPEKLRRRSWTATGRASRERCSLSSTRTGTGSGRWRSRRPGGATRASTGGSGPHGPVSG